MNQTVLTPTMTAERAKFFLRRFKQEEKLLDQHEQAALDFAIENLSALAQQEPVALNDQLLEALKMVVHNPFREGTRSHERIINYAKVIIAAAEVAKGESK